MAMTRNDYEDRGAEDDIVDDNRTGLGKCNLPEAIFSPGASNVTTGAPNVAPRREASDPPSECPMTQIFDSGYM